MAHRDASLIQLARVVAPVNVLGPGSRVGIWVQGCRLACEGCGSTDTWDPAAGEVVHASILAEQVLSLLAGVAPDGVTITGGEPTDQGAGLTEFVNALRRARPDVDVCLFTGRPSSVATAVAPGLVALADCLVAGPYKPERPRVNALVATDNQTISYRDSSVRDRYEAWLGHGETPRLQVAADDQDVFLFGMPMAGDLLRFREALERRGITLGEVSWRS
jgi:anaerobic ribonucleoside-triphosphate reductase activating protein